MSAAAELSEEKVLEVLKTIRFPGLSRDIVSFGFVKDLQVGGGNVSFRLEMQTSSPRAAEEIRRDATERLRSLAGVHAVTIQLDVREPAPMPPRGAVHVRMVRPVNAPCAPSSARAMCADDSQRTSWPTPTRERTASTLAIDPVGVKSAASLPKRPATFSSRARTVGSSPYTSSPTSAEAIAARMASVGLVTVSLRRSITRTPYESTATWASPSISATRKASSSDCTRLRRGSHTDS